jgi:TPR repeat protein
MPPSTAAARSLSILVLLLSLGSPPAACAQSANSTEPTDEALTPQQMEQRAFDYLLGEGKPVDRVQAIRWFERAATAGQPVSQLTLAEFYWSGTDVAKNPARAIELFRAAASQGVAGAQVALGWAYLTGTEVKADVAQGIRWASAAAKQGDARAFQLLADHYYYGHNGVPKDAQRGKRLLLRAAALDDNEARGQAYALLTGGPAEERDTRLGLYFLTRAAETNDGRYAFTLAREYLFGMHMPHDPALAARWMQRASENDNHTAALWLSQLYLKGIGVARDPKRAEQLRVEALKVATLQERNNFAWDLSVAKRDELRDGAMALQILEAALAAADRKSPGHVDTLAAAYAENGQFDKAVKAQQDAIDGARAAHQDADVSQFEERLALYERHETYREVTP